MKKWEIPPLVVAFLFLLVASVGMLHEGCSATKRTVIVGASAGAGGIVGGALGGPPGAAGGSALGGALGEAMTEDVALSTGELVGEDAMQKQIAQLVSVVAALRSDNASLHATQASTAERIQSLLAERAAEPSPHTNRWLALAALALGLFVLIHHYGLQKVVLGAASGIGAIVNWFRHPPALTPPPPPPSAPITARTTS